MATPQEAKTEEVELGEKMQDVATNEPRSDSTDEAPLVATPAIMNKAKWLACIALCFCYTTSFQQNATTAAIVKHIDSELGPTTYYNWILSSYTITTSIALPLSGGLSDIFGRRPFFLVGCCISLSGTIVALAAQNVPMIIVGMILKGIGAGSQQLALAAVAELVPNKHRGNAQAVLDLVTMPWSVFGSLLGNVMVKYSRLSFRINFIIGVILNLLSIASIWFFYHPPNGIRVEGKSNFQRILELDWVGIILMAVGIVLTLMGLSFGGNPFPWKSAGVIAPMIIGMLSLIALGFWEWKVARHPFFAHELFIGKPFTLLLFLTFIGGMSLYTAAAFWTQQCQGMFTTDPLKIGLSTLPGGFGGAVGGFLGGILIGKSKFLKTNHVLTYAVALKLLSDGLFTTLTPDKFTTAMGFGFLAMFGMGLMLVALIVCVQLSCDDEHIGLATLVLGSVRSIGGSVAVTIYTSIMLNTVKEDAGPRIGEVVIPAGLPQSSLPPLVKLLLGGRPRDALKVPGVSPKILGIAVDAAKWSWTLAFKRIYYAALAFTSLALVATFFMRDLSGNMTDKIAVTLTNDKPHDDKNRAAEA